MEVSPDTIARHWMESVWTERDLDALDELHAPGFVDHSSSGRAADRAAYREGIVALFVAFPDFRAKIEDMIVDREAGKVAIRWSAVGTHRGAFLGWPATARAISFRGIEILAIAGGRIEGRWGEWDLVRQLEASSLIESSDS